MGILPQATGFYLFLNKSCCIYLSPPDTAIRLLLGLSCLCLSLFLPIHPIELSLTRLSLTQWLPPLLFPHRGLPSSALSPTTRSPVRLLPRRSSLLPTLLATLPRPAP